MNPVKRYLLIFFAVYIGGAILGNVVLGPPGYSAAYREQYKAEHDRYLGIVKSEEYRHYRQRPELNEFDPQLAAFVEEYESREAFRQERLRQFLYTLFFDSFTVVMTLILIVHFGRAPLMRILDDQVAAVRTKIEQVQAARREAAQRKEEAQSKVETVPAERERVSREAETLIAQERAQTEAVTEQMREQLVREMEDRKEEEMHAAAQRLKSALVDEAIALLTERCKAQMSPEMHARQVERFIRDVEAHT